MSTDHRSDSQFSEEDVAVLARHAGLTISADRLPLVTRELNIASSAANDLLPIPVIELAGVADAFDPAWPTDTKRRAG